MTQSIDSPRLGGLAPLGYRVEGRKLVVLPPGGGNGTADFFRYRELGSVRRLQQALDREASARSRVA